MGLFNIIKPSNDLLYAFDVHVSKGLNPLEKIKLILDRINNPEESKDVVLAYKPYLLGLQINSGGLYFTQDESFTPLNLYYEIKNNKFNASAVPVLSSHHDRYDIQGGVIFNLYNSDLDNEHHVIGQIGGTYNKIRKHDTISTYNTTVNAITEITLPDGRNLISSPYNLVYTWYNSTNTYEAQPFSIELRRGNDLFRLVSDDDENKNADGKRIYGKLIKLLPERQEAVSTWLIPN
uniref:Uncharacterized protein n=1 Tax=viral metagenome TaxID=1070528 RepID=A0A6C0KPL2_9ZZZZ